MIGIFDSGVGGLTVAKEIVKRLPGHKIIYFGDTARLPYGTKGASFVRKYSFKITEWLTGKGADVIIIACHTSSAWAAPSLKKKFSVPIFEMISPSVKEALSATRNKKIGVIGTSGTIKSGSYEKKLRKLDGSLTVYSVACPLFVPLVEEGWLESKITLEIARKYLEPLKAKNIDTLILGCTHYPLLIEVIRKVMGKGVEIINPAESLAKELEEFLGKGREKETHSFFFSDKPYNFEKISRNCFKEEVKIKIKNPFL